MDMSMDEEDLLSLKVGDDDSDSVYNEDDFLDICDDDFGYQIKERGRYYYNMGNVLSCNKAGNKYFAKVQGSKKLPYKVTIENTEDGLYYNCNCPYNAPCKHEYAVLVAITYKEYNTIDLKPEIAKSKDNIQEIISLIPADKLKEFLLSNITSNTIHFNISLLEKYFQEYVPIQDYEYYYNNLYNSLILDSDFQDLLSNYIDIVKNYISNLNFAESFKIIKSIFEAYNDTNMLNKDKHIIDEFPKIGMFLRVIYRNADKELKSEISRYIDVLQSNYYYNNLYLEDIIVILLY